MEKYKIRCRYCNTLHTIKVGGCLKCRTCSRVTPWYVLEDTLFDEEELDFSDEEFETLDEDMVEEFNDEEEIR